MTEYGNGEAVDTEQFRNVQESERYGIHVYGTKIFVYLSFILQPGSQRSMTS